ncbi:hypothetical protein [Cellulomonas sp. URHD0024]|uniref:hypothetical protein n=1 Tax=Cellulomonas sp. URHD0024 TaxID=1302620 RepID=UPI00041FAF31|nr:hypothetical protein [Cellulomonas sp. URHD0024]
MSVLTSGSARTTTADRPTTTASEPITDQLADSVDWFAGTLASWRRSSWCRAVAVLAMLGAVGDALTTSRIPHVEGIHEGNPVSAAGQAFVGSVPVFMVLVTIPLVLIFLVLANRPRSAYTWFIWFAVASVGAVKLVVTYSNLVVLGTAAAG